MNAVSPVVLTLVSLALLVVPLPPMFQPPVRSTRWSLPSGRHRRAIVVGVGLFGVGVLTSFWPWWVGLTLGIISAVVSRRLPERRSAAERTGDRRRLAVHADLVAACLDSGMAIGAALSAVSAEAGGPGELDPLDPIHLLDAVAALLLLGADPEQAWKDAGAHPDLAGLAAAARRSAVGGTTFADAVREHAVTLRAAVSASAEQAASRAGVVMTAPLGLCFLPAFLCLGLAPVVLGLLSTLHLF